MAKPYLGQLREALETRQIPGFSPWSGLAWIGSFGLGVTAFLTLAERLHFEYRSSQDIVSVPAFTLYPESGDWRLYLLALAIISILTLLGFALWIALVSLCRRIQGDIGKLDVGAITLSYLIWWVRPLTYAFEHNRGTVPLALLSGVFVAVNGVYLGQCWLRRRAESRPADAPPSLSMQGAIALVGAGVGLSLLVAPWTTPFHSAPSLTIVGFSIAFWVVWMVGSYTTGRTLNASWRATAGALAVGSLPLFLLFLVPLPLWEVRQGGELVESHGSSLSTVILVCSALSIAAAVSFWALRSLKSGRLPASRIFWQWFFLLVVPILLYMTAYNPSIHRRPIDLFHEGERLAPAQALMDGQVPFRDVVFVHGFIRDPGVALVGFRLFGVSIAALRAMEQIIGPVGLIASYYLAYACIGGWGALLYSLLIATGLWFYYWDWRIAPALLALLFLVLYVRRRRTAWIVAAGVFTFLALVTGFDTGVIALAAGVVVTSGLVALQWREVRLRPILGYGLALAACGACLLPYLAVHGAVVPFIDWHLHIGDISRDWTGLPFPLPVQGLNHAWQTYFSPLLSMVAIVFLLWSFVKKRWRNSNWIVVALAVSNFLMYNRSVIKGSTEPGSLSMGAHFAPLLLLVLVGSVSVRNRLLTMAVSAVLCVGLLLPMPTARATGTTLLEALEQSIESHRVEVPGDWVRSKTDRIGSLFIPADQEDSLAKISAFLEGESYWDFTNHAALYFITDESGPTRFKAALHVVTREDQQEVIRDLNQSPPRYVLYRSGTLWDTVNGVDSTLRSFLVSEYLLETYHFADTVGGFTILEYGPPATPSSELQFRVGLGKVPYLWGKDRADALEQLEPLSIAEWDFTHGDAAGWQAELDVAQSELRGDGWQIWCDGADAQLVNLNIELDPTAATYLALQMSVRTGSPAGTSGQIFWRSGNDGFSEDKSLLFDLVPEGQEHLYLIRLASFPSWSWSDQITGLRLDPVNSSGAEAVIHSIELMHVDELGLGEESP